MKLAPTKIDISGWTNYPWSAETNDDQDLTPANVGQLKQVFSFEVP